MSMLTAFFDGGNMNSWWKYGTVVLAAVILQACDDHTRNESLFAPDPDPTVLQLRWVKAYEDESLDQVLTGLRWTFLFLGAELPAGSFDKAVTVSGSNISVNIDELGFDQQAQDALVNLNHSLLLSEEHKQQEAMDLGRFVALTINASNHYYAITGMPETMEEFEANLSFMQSEAAIVESTVADAERLIDLPDTLDDLGRSAFVSREGSGSIKDGSFETQEFEVTDLMPNGQFRFGIYDAHGKRIPAGDPALGVAGKPAKCLWCHESTLQPPFGAVTAVPGYHPPSVLEAVVENRIEALEAFRQTLDSDIDFNETQEHTEVELLYISFMEPSAARLALEWGMSEAEVQYLLSDLPTHEHVEFPFLGTLYDRDDVDGFAPYETIRVSESAREQADYEPDLID